MLSIKIFPYNVNRPQAWIRDKIKAANFFIFFPLKMLYNKHKSTNKGEFPDV